MRGSEAMDHAELSLGLPGSMMSEITSSASTESDAIAKRKRKMQQTWDHGIDLHLNHPLPLEWEQCLDLQVNTFSLSLSPSLFFSYITQLDGISVL